MLLFAEDDGNSTNPFEAPLMGESEESDDDILDKLMGGDDDEEEVEVETASEWSLNFTMCYKFSINDYFNSILNKSCLDLVIFYY